MLRPALLAVVRPVKRLWSLPDRLGIEKPAARPARPPRAYGDRRLVDRIRIASEHVAAAEIAARVVDLVDKGDGRMVGVKALEELLGQVSELRGVHVRGLMAIPPVGDVFSEKYTYFDEMYKLYVDIRAKKYDNTFINVLSMGMSGDYTQAIKAGSNMVRVGSAIFGSR